MFWKLCKFEWKSSYRMYVMFYAILLVCSVLIGMGSFHDIKLPGILEFLVNLTIIIYSAGIFAISILTIVFIFRNYVKSMYQRQAYLTHTLPVAAWQLMLVKLVSALLWMILTFLVTMLSVWILMMFAGIDVFGEFSEAISHIWNEIPNHTELLLSLLWVLLEMIEMISLVYFVINLVHTTYIQRYRTAIGIFVVLGIAIIESLCDGWLNNMLINIDMLDVYIIIIYIVIDAVIILCWNFASVYLLEHKMEVE